MKSELIDSLKSMQPSKLLYTLHRDVKLNILFSLVAYDSGIDKRYVLLPKLDHIPFASNRNDIFSQ